MTGRDDPVARGRGRGRDPGRDNPRRRSGGSAADHSLQSEDALDRAVPIDSDAVGQSWEVAERSRPDLSDETADGLTPLEEEMRRRVEDVPVGPIDDEEPGPPPLQGSDDDEAAEGLETAENYGDFPGLTDQEESGGTPPGRRGR
jgi:hypothetical protein